MSIKLSELNKLKGLGNSRIPATNNIVSNTVPSQTKPITISLPTSQTAKLSGLSGLSGLSKLKTLGTINGAPENKQNPTTNNLLPANQITVYDNHGNPKLIELNKEQQQFRELVSSAASCVLIGAAGTGKTTCTKAAIQSRIDAGEIPPLTGEHKHLIAGSLGIVICAYTRRATQNIKRQMPEGLAANTITIHKLLEYQPVYYQVTDEETGKIRTKRVFEPARNIANPLSESIKMVVIDEASMVSTELFQLLLDALPHKPQIVFIGDIQQLPPVFGHAILGYKLLELPVIELTQVYRQALESPIIKLAHHILSGKVIIDMQFKNWQYPKQLQIIPFPKRLESERALLETMKMFFSAYDSGSYDITEDTILCPQDRNDNLDRLFGCKEINKHIANYIARKEGRETYEVICGFQKHYFSIGEKILYDKQDGTIIEITQNSQYIGKEYQAPSIHLDYWGHNELEQAKQMQNTDIDLDKLIELSGMTDDEDRTVKASHAITIRLDDEDSTIEVSNISDIQKIALGYAMTVHKSQGSEWRKVFLLLHNTHNAMLKRELLYTAVTRAREQLIIVCEKDSLSKGITQQAIKGNTLDEKARYFMGKIPSSTNESN